MEVLLKSYNKYALNKHLSLKYKLRNCIRINSWNLIKYLYKTSRNKNIKDFQHVKTFCLCKMRILISIVKIALELRYFKITKHYKT